MRTERLFLFAAYDPHGIVGKSLVFHIMSLARHGDVVVVMDNDASDDEVRKLLPYVKHIEAAKHGEYDFGSYKRAYMWSREHLEMDSYDYCYLANDSVYGPLHEIGPLLEEMEGLGVDAFGPVINRHRHDTHIQSWFIGFGKKVFMSRWFGDFICRVSSHEEKSKICSLYETGLTKLIENQGIKYDALFRLKGKAIYNSVQGNYLMGIPFIKKSSFTRHNASLGAQVKYILDDCMKSGSAYEREAAEAILEDAGRLYGEDYMDHLLCSGRLEMAGRYIIYIFKKIIK